MFSPNLISFDFLKKYAIFLHISILKIIKQDTYRQVSFPSLSPPLSSLSILLISLVKHFKCFVANSQGSARAGLPWGSASHGKSQRKPHGPPEHAPPPPLSHTDPRNHPRGCCTGPPHAGYADSALWHPPNLVSPPSLQTQANANVVSGMSSERANVSCNILLRVYLICRNREWKLL